MTKSVDNYGLFDQGERIAAAQERTAAALEGIAASLAEIVPIIKSREDRDPLRMIDEILTIAETEGGQHSGKADSSQGEEIPLIGRELPDNLLRDLPADMVAKILAERR